MGRLEVAVWAVGGLLAAVGPGCGQVPPTVAVTPSPSSVLTCSTERFRAQVGNSPLGVSWSVTPASGAGSIDALGVYTAPTGPIHGTAVVTASSQEDSTVHDSSQVTLATAFPGPAVPLAGSAGFASPLGAGSYTHAAAASGARAYAVWPDNPASATKVSMKLARSDDGGATWSAPVDVLTAKVGTSGGMLECPAVAVDAGDKDVVYVIARVSGPSDFSAPLDHGSLDGDATQLVATSIDGGNHFTTRVLHVGTSGGICADVASPAADTVVVVSPGTSCTPGTLDARDMFVWSDPMRGAGFSARPAGVGVGVANEYFAAGYSHGLDHLQSNDRCSGKHLFPASDGGTGSTGDTTEAPRLFTDGAGNLCVTYIGYENRPAGTVTHAYLQCSSDAGGSFSAPLALSTVVNPIPSSASGALGKNDEAAVAWTTGGGPGGKLYVAAGTGDGKTFGAAVAVPTYRVPGQTAGAPAYNPTVAYDANGVLWLAYHASDGGSGFGLIVQKSCDGGKTWSEPVLVNEGAGMDVKWPSLLVTSDPAPVVVAWASDGIEAFPLSPSGNVGAGGCSFTLSGGLTATFACQTYAVTSAGAQGTGSVLTLTGSGDGIVVEVAIEVPGHLQTGAYSSRDMGASGGASAIGAGSKVWSATAPSSGSYSVQLVSVVPSYSVSSSGGSSVIEYQVRGTLDATLTASQVGPAPDVTLRASF